MFAIAGALVACNDNASTTDTTADSIRIADSIKRAEDSIKALTPVVPDSLTVVVPDSLKVDTSGKK